MATAVSRYTPQSRADDGESCRAVSAVSSSLPTQGTFNYLYAKSITCNSDDQIIYTSLNMPFIPEPHNSDEELRACADGHFGPVDCFQWPQVYCKKYEYTICICWNDHHPSPDPLSWACHRTIQGIPSTSCEPILCMLKCA